MGTFEVVAVTGATGFIGFNLVRHLLAEGVAVRCLGRRSRPELDALGVEVCVVDLCNADALERALAGVTAVMHVAGHFGAPAAMEQANVATTDALVWASGRAEVQRFLYCSSSVTVGFGPREQPGTEATPLDPQVYGTGQLRAYYETKQRAEQLTLAAKSLEPVVVNPDYIIGPWDFGPTSGQILVELARGLRFYPQGGKCFQAVDDCVRGMVAALERGRAGQRYHLGGHNLSYRQLLEMAAPIVGVAPPRWPLPHGLAARMAPLLGYEAGSIRAMALDRYRSGTKAERELGITSRPLEPAIAEAVQWFREHGAMD